MSSWRSCEMTCPGFRWNTLCQPAKESTIETYNIKKERKDLYAPRSDVFEIVEVPPMKFLMVDGHGDPNTSAAYREAVEALYTASYAVRAMTKARLGKVHTVGPLEGLWSAADPDAFRTRDKSSWDWTMMIVPAHGLTPTGRHHEIYLSDPRKTEPARLKTILRQPVGSDPAGGP